jgi:purine/pyrimidine-nucleoside phosphorylase
MSEKIPEKFDDVTVICKANVYFEGKVVSHSVLFEDGKRKTLGLIYPGTFNFNTDSPEKMEITTGKCLIRLLGQKQWKIYSAGEYFKVDGNSAFEIIVDEGIMEYICSFE